MTSENLLLPLETVIENGVFLQENLPVFSKTHINRHVGNPIQTTPKPGASQGEQG